MSPVRPSAARNRRNNIEEFQPRAEDLFDVPVDKESKKTADAEFSPQVTEEDVGGETKAGEIAARALDLPISTSHSPQTQENAQAAAAPKPNNFAATAEENKQEEEQLEIKISEYFYNDNTLGLDNSPEEVARRELAQQVLTFMWQLCLDDSVFGG